MTPDPDITARELAESLMHRWTRDAVTPEPGPYGADLPIIARLRDEQVEFWYGGEPTVGPLLAALDAANAEVLALREAAKNVRSMLERHTYDQESLLHFVAQDILALFPAPTEEEQRG